MLGCMYSQPLLAKRRETQVQTKMNDESDEAARSTNDDHIAWANIWQTLEMGCWIAIVAMPIMYWISGSAVSRDQAWIRTAMMVVAVTGVVCSTAYRVWRLRR